MIIPTYSNFASTPNAGSAYVGGAGVGQRAVEARMNNAAAMAGIAQRASEAQMQQQLGMQKLEQERVEAEMMNQSRQAAMQQEVLQKQQQFEIEKAYNQSIIGLKQQEIARQKAVDDWKIKQVADQYAAQQKLVLDAENRFATGQASSPEEGYRQAVMQHGLQAGGSLAEVAKFMEAGAAGSATPPPALPVPNLESHKAVKTGPDTWQYIKTVPEVPEGVEQIAGTEYDRIDGKVVPRRESPETKTIREDIKRMKEKLDGRMTSMHRRAMAKEASKEKLTKVDKIYIEQYKGWQQQLADMEAKLKRGSSSAPSGTNRIKILNIRKKE